MANSDSLFLKTKRALRGAFLVSILECYLQDLTVFLPPITVFLLCLKAQGHVTVNKPVISIINFYNLYCFPHVAIVLRTDFGVWGESTRQLLPKIHQYLFNRTTYEYFVCFSTKLKSPSSK